MTPRNAVDQGLVISAMVLLQDTAGTHQRRGGKRSHPPVLPIRGGSGDFALFRCHSGIERFDSPYGYDERQPTTNLVNHASCAVR